ncbi:MAG: uroporphyrinogen decarboxylase [Pseudomonadota bacterium]
MATDEHKPLLSVLHGNRRDPLPMWMMRQAGRHLPEYLELRGRAKNFMDFCFTPSLAAEATLQPVRRYDMDGAILFADILLVLDAMGRSVRFEPGIGPIVDAIDTADDLAKVPMATVTDRLSPVYETVSRVKGELGADKTLIGFAGSPWTVLLYAIEGRGKTDRSKAKLWAYGNEAEMAVALDHLVEATAQYLLKQAEAGADALMLFDSWAEGLSISLFEQLIIAPTRSLVARLRALGVTQPIIGFPRGAGAMLPSYIAATGVDACGLDTAVVPSFIQGALPAGFPVQGHLDPLALVAGGARLDAEVDSLLAAYADRPHIFNLGHGILPETPIEHVEAVVRRVRKG